jgi:hypothetical protein
VGAELVPSKETEKSKVQIAQFKQKDDRTLTDSVEVILAKALAIFLWIYLLANTFLFNIDSFLYSRLPDWISWIVKYKVLLFLGGMIFFVSRFSRAKMIFYPVYLLTFPVAQFIKLMFGLAMNSSWSAIIAVLNFIFSVMRHLKRSLKFLFLFLVMIILSIFVDTPVSNATAFAFAVGLILLVHYQVFVDSFSPSDSMNIYAAIFDKAFDHRKSLYMVDGTFREVDVDDLNEKQLELRNNKLDASMVHNRLCLFFARRLREYHASAWRLLPPTMSSLSLLAWNILLFAFAYYSLWRAKPEEFDLSVPGRFFEFFFSASTI